MMVVRYNGIPKPGELFGGPLLTGILSFSSQCADSSATVDDPRRVPADLNDTAADRSLA